VASRINLSRLNRLHIRLMTLLSLMIDRIFTVRDIHTALRKTLLWSLIIAVVAVVATQAMYEVFLPEIMAEYGTQLRVFAFLLTLAISVPFVGLFSIVMLRMGSFNSQLREMARRDGLTGLLNRTALQDIIRRRGQEPRGEEEEEDALILIDIDHFKMINDTHGHAAGDHVLRMVAVSIAGNVFERDHAARIGGEEFAVFLLGAGASGAVKAAERIRAALEENKTYYEGNIIRVTASLGGALFPREASYNTIFQGADFALYRAKRSGRNQCEFNGLPAIWQSRKNPDAVGDSNAA
jgi:diguanylate cyclase (GGDEF)-like protein